MLLQYAHVWYTNIVYITRETWSKGGMIMCNMEAKWGLLRCGESIEGTLHFLFELILLSSVVRVLINWVFGI